MYIEGFDDLSASVERGHPILDGAMSPLTRELIAMLGADGVDMNSWWAMTPQNWTCSACGRSKHGIARLNTKRELMCHLVEHHDHVKDLLEKRFQEISSAQDEVVADDAAKRFANRAAAMVSAYENTVICSDCNTADPDAKRAIGADKNFSFSAAELRRIVRPDPNAPHINLDLTAAREIWESHRKSFDLRMKIVQRIAEIAATNTHWFQESDPRSRPSHIQEIATTAARAHVSLTRNAILELCGTRRTNRTASANSWRTRRYPAVKVPPSDREIEHVAKVDSHTAWQLVPDSWTCECCRRSKRETVRASTQSPWFFKADNRHLCNPSDAESSRPHWLCEDCCWAARELGREAARVHGLDISSYSRYVTLKELASIVQARPHAMHEIRNNVAEQVVEAVARRMAGTRQRE